MAYGNFQSQQAFELFAASPASNNQLFFRGTDGQLYVWGEIPGDPGFNGNTPAPGYRWIGVGPGGQPGFPNTWGPNYTPLAPGLYAGGTLSAPGLWVIAFQSILQGATQAPPAAAIVAAPQQQLVPLQQQQQQGNVSNFTLGGGNMGNNNNGGGGLNLGGGNSNLNIGALIAGQQQSASVSAAFAAQQALMVAQTTAATKGGYAVAILGFLASAFGFNAGAQSGGGNSQQAALLLALLGTSALTALNTALSTVMAALQLPTATFTTQSAAYNAFLSSLTAALAGQANNTLIAQLGSGSSPSLIGLILQQNANSAFAAANPQVASPWTTAQMDSAFATLESSFLAWLNSASTNALLLSAAS